MTKTKDFPSALLMVPRLATNLDKIFADLRTQHSMNFFKQNFIIGGLTYKNGETKIENITFDPTKPIADEITVLDAALKVIHQTHQLK